MSHLVCPAAATHECYSVWTTEANHLRLQLADKLSEQFAGVKLFDTELDQAKFCAANWPCALGDSIVEEIMRAHTKCGKRAGVAHGGI